METLMAVKTCTVMELYYIN